MHNTVNSLN